MDELVLMISWERTVRRDVHFLDCGGNLRSMCSIWVGNEDGGLTKLNVNKSDDCHA